MLVRANSLILFFDKHCFVILQIYGVNMSCVSCKSARFWLQARISNSKMGRLSFRLCAPTISSR